MAFSGLAARGAVGGLEELLGRQLAEEMARREMEALQEEREAQRAYRERDFGMRGLELATRLRGQAADDRRADAAEARAQAEAKAKADERAHRQTTLSGLAEMDNDPRLRQVRREHAIASGVDLPSYLSEGLKDPEMVNLETVDAQGRKVTRAFAKGGPELKAGVPGYVQPPQYKPEYEWVTQPDGTVKKIRSDREISDGSVPFNKTGARVTGVHSRALGFFNQGRQADEDIEPLEPTVAKMPVWDQARMEWAPNFAQSELGRSYIASQRAFTEARLRKVSGAAVPDAEYKNDRMTFFAIPGDDETTIQNKRRARASILASIAYEAGPALEGFYGDEAEGMIGDYRARAAKGGGGRPKVGDIVTLKDGTRRRVTSIDANGNITGEKVP